MADSIGYLYTVGGYATLIGLGYVIYQVSTKKSKKRVGAVPIKVAKAVQPEPRKEDKKKKQRLETFVSEAQETSVKSSKPEPQEKERAPEPKSPAKDDGEGLDNREFAKRLAKAQEGHKLNSTSEGSKQREKSVKQSRANKIKNAAEEKPGKKQALDVLSAPSSNGADADDDASSANSPESRPVDESGVSDMLEPTPAGPSILRLTDTTSNKKQKKTAKATEAVETKKQRQNRKKAEAAKAVREETEKERKVLEEKQRRTARIAEGRPAKDGSAFMAANGGNSAWVKTAPNGTDTEKTDDSTLYEPLDTFEKPASASATSKNESSLKQESSWISTLPSEEEQMEMLRDESDEWSTVKTKSKKSKKAPSSDSGEDLKTSQPASQAKQAAAKDNKTTKAAPSQNFGAFSALTVKDDSEELEEEWEV